MKSILGIEIPRWAEFIDAWKEIFLNIFNFDIYTILIWVITVLIAIIIKKYFKKIPNLLIALVLWSVLAYFLKNFSSNITFVPTIPSKLPSFAIPELTLENIRTLASSALAVAILWLIEAVSISESIATKSNQMINANQEFIGQWMSNIVWSFFSSYAWSGSFTRSWINYEAGAKTPFSAIFAAIFLMIIILIIAPITKYISIPAMAWVIMLVWYSLIDFPHIKHILKVNKSETFILTITFFATLFLELEFAIYIGIIISLIMFLNKTSTPKIVSMLSIYDEVRNKKTLISKLKVDENVVETLRCPQLDIIRIDMSIYFWSTNHIHRFINRLIIHKKVKHIIMLCSSVNLIDMTGMEMLEKVSDMLKKEWGWLYFLEIKTNVMKELKKSWFVKNIGEENFFNVKKEAIALVHSKLNKDICKNCKKKVFKECNK